MIRAVARRFEEPEPSEKVDEGFLQLGRFWQGVQKISDVDPGYARAFWDSLRHTFDFIDSNIDPQLEDLMTSNSKYDFDTLRWLNLSLLHHREWLDEYPIEPSNLHPTVEAFPWKLYASRGHRNSGLEGILNFGRGGNGLLKMFYKPEILRKELIDRTKARRVAHSRQMELRQALKNVFSPANLAIRKLAILPDFLTTSQTDTLIRETKEWLEFNGVEYEETSFEGMKAIRILPQLKNNWALNTYAYILNKELGMQYIWCPEALVRAEARAAHLRDQSVVFASPDAMLNVHPSSSDFHERIHAYLTNEILRDAPSPYSIRFIGFGKEVGPYETFYDAEEVLARRVELLSILQNIYEWAGHPDFEGKGTNESLQDASRKATRKTIELLDRTTEPTTMILALSTAANEGLRDAIQILRNDPTPLSVQIADVSRDTEKFSVAFAQLDLANGRKVRVPLGTLSYVKANFEHGCRTVSELKKRIAEFTIEQMKNLSKDLEKEVLRARTVLRTKKNLDTSLSKDHLALFAIPIDELLPATLPGNFPLLPPIYYSTSNAVDSRKRVWHERQIEEYLKRYWPSDQTPFRSWASPHLKNP